MAAALPSGSLWEGVAAGYYSQAKQWSGGHHPNPASFLAAGAEIPTSLHTPLPYCPPCLPLQVCPNQPPAPELWGENAHF